MATQDWPDSQVKAREEKIRQAMSAKGLAQTDVEVRNATRVAEWLNRHPALVAKHFNLLPPDFEPLSFRLALPQHGREFHPDEQRAQLTERIVAELSDADGERHIRIEGPAGIGKSRVAIEALRPWADLTLYAANAPDSPAFGRHLVMSGKAAILILDECSRLVADAWYEVVALAEGRIRLITVDLVEGAGTTGENVIQLSGLGRSELMAVAHDAATTLDERQLEWVASMCEGFVKLAGPLALALASAGAGSAAELVRTGNVHALLKRLIEDATDRRVMTGLALFLRVGFREELRPEATAIAAYLGLDWVTFHDAAQRMIDRELLAERGRYLYVTPNILAIWLVAAELRRQGADITRALEQDGSPASDLFWRRIGQLQGNEDAERLAREVLGVDSPFRSMQQLNSEGASKLFLELSKVAPVEGARILDRLTRQTSIPELQAMEVGRRNLVWALEHLAERADTFEPAASSLLRLAAAENEDYANNATGTFHALFLTFLGRTVAPAPHRLDVLARLLDDASEEEANVAIEALTAPLTTSEFGTPIGSPTGGSAPVANWRPATRAEEQSVRRQAFSMLRRQLESNDAARRKAAARVFLSQLRSIVALGLGSDAREIFEGLAQDTVDVDEHELLRAIGQLIEYDARRIDESERAAWEELATRTLNGSFHRQMITRVRGWDDRSWLTQERDDLREEIRDLARQAAARPDLLQAELPWLCGNEDAVNVIEFGRALGSQDEQGALLERLIAATADAGDTRLLALYVDGRGLDGTDLDSLLDRLEREQRTREFLPQLLLRLPRPSDVWERFKRLVVESPDAQSTFDYYIVQSIARELSNKDVIDLIHLLIERATPASTQNALQILAGRLQEHDAGGDLVELAWQALEYPGEIAGDTMWTHWWSSVARSVSASDRSRVAELLIDRAEDDPVKFTFSRLAGLFSEVMSQADVRTWEWLVSRLDSNPSLEMALQWWSQKEGFLEQVPLPTLKAWAQEDAARLERLAQFAKAGEVLSPFVIWLVEQAGPKSRAARLLRAQMRTGVFSGSEAQREERFRSLFEQWARDAPSPVLREWASEGATETNERLPRIQQREAEEFRD